MKLRPPAERTIAVRSCALILALGTIALAGERPLAVAEPNPSASAYYKIKNLGTFHPDPLCSTAECYSAALDVNIWGQVVGYSSWQDGSTYGTSRGFRTGPNQVIAPSDVLQLPPRSSAYSSNGSGVNDSGVAVGHVLNSIGQHAYMWPLPSQVLALGPGVPNYASAINSDGVVVGGGARAWIGNTSTLLPTGSGYDSGAYDINDNGIVVGFRGKDNEVPFRAFRWSSGWSSVEELGTLNLGCTTCDSYAYAINDPGIIVGMSEFDAQQPGVWHAFAWPVLFTNPLEMVDLGTLCSEADNNLGKSSASDINIHSHIVGNSETAPSGELRAFLYKGTTMTNLRTLLSPAHRIQWRLTHAEAINDLGQIAGIGNFQGNRPRAYLMTPPLPGIFANLGALVQLFLGVGTAEHLNLDARLSAAEAAFDTGDRAEAQRHLELYQAEVHGLVRDSRLTPLRATRLFAGVALIQREIESDAGR